MILLMPKPDPKNNIPVHSFIYPNKDYWDNIQKMANRMAFSQEKYGNLADAYPDTVDAIANLKERLAFYEETGNVEWLIDAANFAIIEAIHPAHTAAHFRSTDSDESPGLRSRSQ
jgi:hypothetical protein